MARFYSNENVPRQVVEGLRKLGHDVLTSFEAGNANQSIADDEVLRFAVDERRILLTINRKHLHDFISHRRITLALSLAPSILIFRARRGVCMRPFLTAILRSSLYA